MSSLSKRDQVKLEKVFDMETGYVGHYNNTTFQNMIIGAVDIDVYDGEYKNYTSKAKKLRHFIDIESDECVGTVILTMLDERELRRISIDEPDPYEGFASELRIVATAMTGGQRYNSNEERLNASIAESQTVLNDLIKVAERLCTNAAYRHDTKENLINDYYRDMLRTKGYVQLHDQSRHGLSYTGKESGSVDLLLEKGEKEVAIIEAFRLSSIDEREIKKHIDKAVINYNPLGTPTFLLIYAGSSDFDDLWKGFLHFIKGYNFELDVKKQFTEEPHPNASTRVCSGVLCRDDFDFPVILMMVNMYKRVGSVK